MRLILIIFISCLSLTARGQSYQEHLNSPTPQWLNIAKPIHVSPEPLEVDDSISKELVDKTGGAKFIEKNEISIPSLGISQEFPFPVKSISLSPDQSKIIVENRSTPPYARLYEITNNGLHESSNEIPELTYDDESRGLILNWFFASEDIIIGEATVSDKKGNTLLDSRVYTFNINDNSLARLDLNDFKDGSDTFFDVESVTKNLDKMVLLINKRRHLVSVDLAAPHIPLESKKWSPSASLSRNSTSKENKNLANRETSSLEKTSPYGILKWIIIGALLLVTAWMFGKDYLKRS